MAVPQFQTDTKGGKCILESREDRLRLKLFNGSEKPMRSGSIIVAEIHKRLNGIHPHSSEQLDQFLGEKCLLLKQFSLRALWSKPALGDTFHKISGLPIAVEPPPDKFIKHSWSCGVLNVLKCPRKSKPPVIQNRPQRVDVWVLFDEIHRLPRSRGIESFPLRYDLLLNMFIGR